MPLAPTEIIHTPTPTSLPPWGSFPGPSIPPETEIPPPAPLFAQPAGQVNFLLLGSDQRPDDIGFRTDTMVLITLNSELGTVNATSFPRDLYVYIPGWTMQRLNTAFPHGGFELMQTTFEYNFGVRPDFYILTNFWSFTAMIDSLGGINVNVPFPHTDHRDGLGDYTVPAGVIPMDGETALWYVRSRTTTNDFDRARRQQEVLLAIFYRLLNLNGLQRAPELYSLYRNNVSTNVALDNLTPFLGLAADLAQNQADLSSFIIGSDQVIPFRTNSGAAVLLPEREAVLEIIGRALNRQ